MNKREVLSTVIAELKKIASAKYWNGTVGDKDDFGDKIKDIIIDGKTNMGPWGLMTERSFSRHGVGLGLGKGQKYKKQSNGKWLKIEG